MFVINPDPYSLPCYRIGPFQTRDLSLNHCLSDSDLIDDYFNDRFFKKEYLYTENGRQAINIALSYFNLKENDVVTIFTTSGNFYISGCVTKEIEKFCKWSRKMEPETRLIFVNHEFGYAFDDLHKLKDYNLPIIEDCANSFFTQDKNNYIGGIGDFVIFSFPKMFPLQIGGLIVSNFPGRLEGQSKVSNERLRYIKNVLSSHIKCKENIIEKRIANYYYLRGKFVSLGFVERFKLDQGTIPGVFMFKTDEHNLDLPELKKFFYAHGTQCSVFYGEETFFIPVHQTLNSQDMDYFCEVMKAFIKKSAI